VRSVTLKLANKFSQCTLFIYFLFITFSVGEHYDLFSGLIILRQPWSRRSYDVIPHRPHRTDRETTAGKAQRYRTDLKLIYTRDAPIIGIGRLLRRYRRIIVYALGKYKKRYEGSRLRRMESGLWMQFHISRRLNFNCHRVKSRHCTCQILFKAQFAPQTTGELRSIAFSHGTIRWISPAHAVWRASTRMSVIYSMRRVDRMKVPRENAADRRSPVSWVRTGP